MTSLPNSALELDAVFLFVLIGISAGQGVSVGSGYLHVPGVRGFATFWRGFWFLVLWSSLVALIIYLATPFVIPLMQLYTSYVPCANFVGLALASASFGIQSEMRGKARVPVAVFVALAVTLGLLAHLKII